MFQSHSVSACVRILIRLTFLKNDKQRICPDICCDERCMSIRFNYSLEVSQKVDWQVLHHIKRLKASLVGVCHVEKDLDK